MIEQSEQSPPDRVGGALEGITVIENSRSQTGASL